MMSAKSNIVSKRDSLVTTSEAHSVSTTTASQNEIPSHWIFAFESEDSPVLPFNIRRFGEDFVVLSDGRQLVFASFEDACRKAKAKFKACPFSGRPVPIGPQNIRQLCRYLKTSYPEVFETLTSNGRIKTLYVFDDGYYLNNRTLHPEMVCKNGLSCHGLNGGCSFNHDGMPWCKNDKNSSSRCRSSKCKYNHGRGRVKHDNLKRSTPVSTRTVPVSTPTAPVKETNRFASLEDFSSVSVNLEEIFDKQVEEIQKSEVQESKDDMTVVSEDGWNVVSTKKSSKKKKPSEKKPSEKKPIEEKKPNVDQFPSLSSVVSAAPTLSWKEKCDLQKAKDEERRRLEEEKALFEEEEKARLEEEAKQVALEAERQAILDAEKQKKDAEEIKQKELEDQFAGMSAYSKSDKEGFLPKKLSKKTSKKKAKKGKSEEEIALMKQLFSK